MAFLKTAARWYDCWSNPKLIWRNSCTAKGRADPNAGPAPASRGLLLAAILGGEDQGRVFRHGEDHTKSVPFPRVNELTALIVIGLEYPFVQSLSTILVGLE